MDSPDNKEKQLKMVIYDNPDQNSKIQLNDSATKSSNDKSVATDSSDSPDSLMHYTCKTLEEMFNVFSSYGRRYGFSVRKSTARWTNDKKVIREQYYVCSCEGVTRERNRTCEDNENKQKLKRKTKFPRTDCKALLRVKLNEDGMYQVVSHVLSHNHDMVNPEHAHFLHSQRRITQEKAEVIKSVTSAGIAPIDSYNFLCHDAGGESSIGHTIKDHYNFVTKLKMLVIESGDAQTLIDLLTSKSEGDVNFFYRVKLDDDGRLSSIFWRDSRMKEDYRIFGDVMIFDTTYRTNKYNLICAPFVGINNHWKNVMFACAFLSDEKEEIFIWLFETFKKSMLGLVPESIFSDQDQAMTNVIEKVFPESRHRLCTWHIHKNVISHFGKLKRDPSFQEAFNKCLRFCSTDEEFYNTWNEMIQKFDLVNESWLRLFELREKWCNALNKDYFSAGLLSSQRSESTNNAISFKANKTTSLTKFYNLFGQTVQRWRRVESADDYSSSILVPDPRVRMHKLVLHAIDVYTKEMFQDFDNEFQKAICSNVKEVETVENTRVFEVHIDGYKHIVCYSYESKFFTCTCKRFEEMKMLCCHVIRIMHLDSFERIPE